MRKSKQVAVVVPAHNEEGLIRRVLETMPDFVDRIYVVDDRSTDGTREQVRCFGAEHSATTNVVLLEHEINSGVGAAIVSGYKEALKDKMDVVAVMAGDAQMNPDELWKIVDPVIDGEADYVKGNRLFSGKAWEIIPRRRYLGNAFLSLLTKIASGYWHVADSQTGYTAISGDALKQLPLEELYPRYGYPNHLLIMLNVFGLRTIDVPIEPIYNIGERSGLVIHKVVPHISWLLIKGFFWRLKEKYVIRDFHPLVFFYLMGLCLFPPGVLLGTWLFAYRIFVGPVAATSALFALFMVVSGLQSLFFAMWFDSEYNNKKRRE